MVLPLTTPLTSHLTRTKNPVAEEMAPGSTPPTKRSLKRQRRLDGITHTYWVFPVRCCLC